MSNYLVEKIKYTVEFNSQYEEIIFVLDYPSIVLEPSIKNTIRFAGWLLSHDDYSIVVRFDNKELEFKSSRDRPDVAKVYRNKTFDFTKKYGFVFEIEFSESYEIFYKANNMFLKIFDVFLKKSTENNYDHKITEFGRQGFLNKYENRKSYLTFIETVKSFQFSFKMLQQAEKLNFLQINNPFDETPNTCRNSFIIRGGINLLYFSGTNPFLIVQFVSSCDAIYFINQKEFLIFAHVTPAHIEEIIQEFDSKISGFPFSATVNNKFGSIIYGHARPYHSIYDGFSGIFVCIENGLDIYNKKFIRIKGSEFIDLIKLFDLDKRNFCVLDNYKDADIDGLFNFRVGSEFTQTPRADNERLDVFVLDAASKVFRKEKENKRPTIWFGITNQKRCWIEQVEAACLIANSLAKTYGTINFYIDGWTSSTDMIAADVKETKADEEILSEILLNLDDMVKVTSLIGLTSLEKISYAGQCDIYIANGSTGSMHVSRFAKKLGISHMNTKLKLGGHIHTRTVVVPDHYVTDIEPDGKRADFIDYSIDPKVVLVLVESLLESVLKKTLK